MKKKKLRMGILICILALVCAGAGYYYYRSTKVPEETAQTEEEPEEEIVEEEEEPEEEIIEEPEVITSLLTNLPISEEYENQRVVAVMTENSKAALPQYGVSAAGVIYECPMEGGMSRMMALYDYEAYTSLERIGNVRSCRPYFAYIASEYDAIYVHFGQSVHGLEVLNTGIVNNLSGLDGSINNTFYRTSDKKAPHNAYTSGEGIAYGISVKGYSDTYEEGERPEHFVFASDENSLSEGADCAALTIAIPDNKPYFVYNGETGLYERYEYGAAQVDANTSEQLAVSNIIIQTVPVGSFGDGTEYLKIDLNGSGTGKYITKGKMIDITWKKDSNTSVTHYYDANGDEIELNSGQTWITLLSETYLSNSVFYETSEEFANR